MEPTLKICSSCPERGQQPIDNFGKNRDRVRSQCKICTAERSRIRKARNREKIREQQRLHSLTSERQQQLAASRERQNRLRRYRRWRKTTMKELYAAVRAQQARADLLEYRSWFPVEPKLDVKNWDRTHDVDHLGHLFLVDHVVVERLIRGRPVGAAGYNTAELHMAMLRLHQLGYHGGIIARRVGLKNAGQAEHILRKNFGLFMPEVDRTDELHERNLW